METHYYAVIFTSKTTNNPKGYQAMATKMLELAQQQPGFIAFESARDTIGISVSYWQSLKAIASWQKQIDHQMAQKLGKENWYAWYKVRVCKVTREYGFNL